MAYLKRKGSIMKYIMVALLIAGGLYQTTQARCHRRRRGSIAGFFSAVTGSALAARSYSDRCYYREGPQYDFAYPAAPLYAYDYPTYVYAPVYSYQRVRYSIYPSYFLRR